MINERGKGKIKQELYRTPRIYLNALLILCWVITDKNKIENTAYCRVSCSRKKYLQRKWVHCLKDFILAVFSFSSQHLLAQSYQWNHWAMCKICLELTINTPERRHWVCSGCFPATLNRFHTWRILTCFSSESMDYKFSLGWTGNSARWKNYGKIKPLFIRSADLSRSQEQCKDSFPF